MASETDAKPAGCGGAGVSAFSLEGAVAKLSGANMALIAVPGRFAAAAADSALDNGLHVLLFSGGVSLSAETALKRKALDKDLLMMGPDCGAAVINGSPLGLANAVSRGSVGIVSSSASGLQEIASIISNEGQGISQALCSGGRDMTREVGGKMFAAGLRALAQDERTAVIVLVSKPPPGEVLEAVLEQAREAAKPIVAVFPGGDADALEEEGIHAAATLEEAALKAAALARYQAAAVPENHDGKSLALAREANRYMMALSASGERLRQAQTEIKRIAFDEARKLHKYQKYLRGLYSGGAFCREAQLLLEPLLGGVWSNAPVSPAFRMKDPLRSQENTALDMGTGAPGGDKPHPAIDFSARLRRIADEARDPAAAVILFDLRLGPGANPHPLEDLLPAVKRARETARCEERDILFITSVTGTAQDPQNRAAVIAGLREAGVIVMPSNAQAASLAGHIIRISGGI